MMKVMKVLEGDEFSFNWQPPFFLGTHLIHMFQQRKTSSTSLPGPLIYRSAAASTSSSTGLPGAAGASDESGKVPSEGWDVMFLG